jgi:hypothetical protein
VVLSRGTTFRHRFLLVILIVGVAGCLAAVGRSGSTGTANPESGVAAGRRRIAFVYTSAPQFDAGAWQRGAERFPEGSRIRLHSAAGSDRDLAPGFFATADPEVSFDGRTVVFSGKRERGGVWQIWEANVGGGREPTRLSGTGTDRIRPLYLSDGRLVCAARHDGLFQLEVLAPGTAVAPLRISYLPGNAAPVQLLGDGRIMFESGWPAGGAAGPVELFTVYDDGSGFEALRCDHGKEHRDPRQVASGDVVFRTGAALGRFTTALSRALAVPAPPGEMNGAVAEIAPKRWLASLRPAGAAQFGIYEYTPGESGAPLAVLVEDAKAGAIQPVVLAARQAPPRHPTGLHPRAGANLLCLNAYETPLEIAEGSVATVRVYGADRAGRPSLLGETAVEGDGSFYVQVPGERPVRIELAGRDGRRIAGESGWFWMRSGEQRICVGCHAGPERAPENKVPQILNRLKAPIKMMPPPSSTEVSK